MAGRNRELSFVTRNGEAHREQDLTPRKFENY